LGPVTATDGVPEGLPPELVTRKNAAAVVTPCVEEPKSYGFVLRASVIDRSAGVVAVPARVAVAVPPGVPLTVSVACTAPVTAVVG